MLQQGGPHGRGMLDVNGRGDEAAVTAVEH